MSRNHALYNSHNDISAFEQEQIIDLKTRYKFDTVEVFHTGPQNDERRYYRAIKDGAAYFVKSGYSDYSHEYEVAKRAFDDNPKYFAEPMYFHTGDVNYFVTRWVNGVGLDEVIKKGKLTKSQKEELLTDLVGIHKTLWNIKVVHRDLIPRNFMVSDGHLIVIDFYWGIEYDQYREYDYVNDNISILGLLGEEFAAGTYVWDDAVSLINIAKYIIGSDDTKGLAAVKEISNSIGKRVIKIDRGVLYAAIIKQMNANIELKGQIAELNDGREQLQHQNSDLQNDNSALRYQNEQLQHQNSSLQQSLSWRITKPLRIIRQRTRRIKK